MTEQHLREDVGDELAHLQEVVQELASLRRDVGDAEPTLRERVAAGAFLAQFYNGIENILKRLSKFHGVPLPDGKKWHKELFDRFGAPPRSGLPVLFDDALARDMTPYQGFRHVVRTSYGTELDWPRMARGIDGIEDVFERFRRAVLRHLDPLNDAS